MFAPYQDYAGFDKNHSYGLFSIYLYCDTIRFSLNNITNVMISRFV